MKRIAIFTAAAFSFSSLAFSCGTASAQEFPSTGHGSFNGAIEIPEAITSPLPPMPGTAAQSVVAPNSPPTSVQPAPGIAPQTYLPQAIPAQRAPAQAVPPQQFSQAPAAQAHGEVFSSPSQIQTFSIPASQPAPQSVIAPQTQYFAAEPTGQAVPMPSEMMVSQSDSNCGCADGSCQGFVIDESQFPQERRQTKRQKLFQRTPKSNDSCTSCAAALPSPVPQFEEAVRPRSNGSVYSTVGVSGLLFDRSHGNNQDFSTNAGGELLSSDNAVNDVLAGIDAVVARRRVTGRGWEARYLGLYPSDESIQIGNNASTLLPGLAQIGTSVSGNDPNAFLTGPSASSFYNSADTHVLTRQTELNNLEFNFLKNSQPRFRACSTELLLGFRYFHFAETLLYEAVDVPQGDPNFPSPESVGYFSSTENHLLGLQIGARSDYQIRRRLMLHVGVKAGAFNNSINTRQRVDYRMADGSVINPTVAGGTLSGERFDIGAEDDVKSILGEVDLSVSLQVSGSSRVRVGYRAMGVTDIAFASNQIQDDFTDASGLTMPNADGDLVTQGGYFGLEFAY
ncbi:BBP7 family outer membrane beta-barrel protein [Mariniblastus fucicola]|uniref:Uncharacterized protein n=1 Tax=Mariniblastus fucicola TaxID=980251 RepID=A0A5B9PGY9_9BACT|nr:BBP7 family outer membrane beta-barrel protein [Mariniblastus fucicola]QEG24530.1 hypothetical protein MFFC18_44500 [Mariniblastus fucicola]